MSFEKTKRKKEKIWEILSKYESEKNISSRNENKRKLEMRNKSNPSIHRKIIPIFIDEEVKIYQREDIMHKFNVFQNERKKKYSKKEIDNIFENLFHNKNRNYSFKKKEKEKKIISLKSPSLKKYLITYQDFENKNKNEFPNINLVNNNLFQFNSKLTKKINDLNEEENIYDSLETEERIIKGLEDTYSFYNKKNSIDKRKIHINKIFKNPKITEIEYFHKVDKVKRAHFMDLNPDNIFFSNYHNNNTLNNSINKYNGNSFNNNYNNDYKSLFKRNNTKLNFFNNNKNILKNKLNYTENNNNNKINVFKNNMNNTMGRLNFNSSNNNINNIKLLKSTSAFKFFNNKLCNKKNKGNEIKIYVKNIINTFNTIK